MTESSELKIIITADDRAKDVLAGNKKSLLDLGDIAGKALTLGMMAGAAGVAALGAGLVSSVGAAGEAELALADLDATLKSTAVAFNQTADAIPHATDEAAAAIEEVSAEHAEGINKIAEEGAARAAELSERVVELNENLAERQATIQGQMAEEADSFNDRMAESSRALNERLTEMAEAHAEHISGLQDKIAGVGEDADERRRTQQERLQETIANIEERTVERREALQERLAETEDAVQRVKLEAQLKKLDEAAAKEKAKAEAKAKAEEDRQARADEKRLAQLRVQLNKENSEYTKQQAKLRADAARREAEYKEEHDKKLTALKATLDRENAEYAKQSAKIRAEQTKVETGTKAHLTKLEADYGEAMGKVAEKFSAIERGLVAPQRASQISRQAILDQAGALQELTRFEDDTIVRGQSMLLTFTNIGRNVFPQATESMLDLATKMGMDVGSAAITLGKALNAPIEGVAALRRYGVMLTDAQEEQVKSLMALGDMEGAQMVILRELQTEVGGAARAAGDTFVGKLDILKNKFGDIQETIGGAMLPGLTLLGDKLIKVLNQPEVQAAITALSKWLADTLPKAIDWGVKLLGDLQEVGLSGVLAKARVWSEDPGTQAFLQGVGTQVGAGIVEGIKITVTSIPIWTGMAVEMGKVAMPILLNVWKGLLKGGAISVLTALGLSPEDATSRVSGIMGFQSGGVVPGPTGRAQLAMVHGGETITPAGGSSGNMTFIYSPQMSLADDREIQARLIPALDRWWADAKRRRVVA